MNSPLVVSTEVYNIAVTKSIKTNHSQPNPMKGQGLHNLAYLLTLDPLEEVKAAQEEVVQKSWNELTLDDRLSEETPETIEAEVQEVPVVYENNNVSYKIEKVEVPENYKTTIPQYEEKAEEVSYQNFEQEAEQEYEQELEDKRFAAQFKLNYEVPKLLGKEIHSTAEKTDRMEMHKVCMGFAESFLRYAMKNLAA